MYNRYIPQNGGYTRVREPDYADEPRRQPQQGSYRQAPYGFQQNAQQEGYRQAPYGAQQHAQEHREAPRQEGRQEPGGAFHHAPPPREERPNPLAGISGLLKKLKLDDIDTGDVLLLLILLFVFLEGDNLELVVALGLLLLMGLKDKDD
ncbi:MAG TPA: hypothetical protein PK597_05325 [Oscillospiraceae bacterium]|nr:hypothetical protein [Oscillospiraceae bacterium]